MYAHVAGSKTRLPCTMWQPVGQQATWHASSMTTAVCEVAAHPLHMPPPCQLGSRHFIAMVCMYVDRTHAWPGVIGAACAAWVVGGAAQSGSSSSQEGQGEAGSFCIRHGARGAERPTG